MIFSLQEKQREAYQKELEELEKRQQQIALDNRFHDNYASPVLPKTAEDKGMSIISVVSELLLMLLFIYELLFIIYCSSASTVQTHAYFKVIYVFLSTLIFSVLV